LSETMEPEPIPPVDESSPSVFAAVTETVTDIFDVVGGMARTTAMLDGMRVEAIAQAITWNGLVETGAPDGSTMSRELRLRALRAELALVLRIPEATAEAMLAPARNWCSTCPPLSLR